MHRLAGRFALIFDLQRLSFSRIYHITTAVDLILLQLPGLVDWSISCFTGQLRAAHQLIFDGSRHNRLVRRVALLCFVVSLE